MNIETTATIAKTNIKNQGGKFLSFFLKEEEYGIEILKVQEIIKILPITRVPRTPEFVKGVINLRGKIIPVTDLRSKFNMEQREETSETCIIVVQTNGLEIGVIVDKVSEVLDISDAEIEDVPSFGTDVSTDYLLGIGNTNGRVRLLLDIERILTAQEVVQIQEVAGEKISA
ncbi:MAG TPA: chemotaxis protein CheW [Pyrinomonadaceae bacterium]|nr:chemotaxis protein CheW [Pyrinomonadaceae bacterium]